MMLRGIVRRASTKNGDLVSRRERLGDDRRHPRRGGSVGRVIKIEKKDPHAAGIVQVRRQRRKPGYLFKMYPRIPHARAGFVIRKPPRTRTSIWVRRKQSSASSGRQTMGSLSLKEVFRTTGTPVRLANSRMSRQ